MLPFLQLVVLAAASYRITRFFVWDSLMGANPESGTAFSQWVDEFAYTEDGSDRSWLRGKIGDLLVCPWCMGWWVSVAVYGVWAWATDQWTGYPIAVHVLSVFAIAGVQGFLDSLTE